MGLPDDAFGATEHDGPLSFASTSQFCLPAARCLLFAAMLIAAAAAETLPGSSNDQTSPNGLISEWGASGSAPQTGSSAYTSGRAFSAPNGQQATTQSDTAAQGAQAELPPPSAPPQQTPDAAEPPASKVLVVIDKPMQEMRVFVDHVERYTWKVSTVP
jgi:hypothetical protein